ncbi:MAG: DNA polymerase [Caudovirales sp. ctOwN3]|nr:MAG: DNA polymerase [Caudovirales sp. ctOwN3]
MDFPNIKDAPIMAIDLETYDPELLDNGPGYGRGKGYIVGIAVAVPGKSWYFPIRHQGDPGNLPVEQVLAWAKEAFSGDGDKVFANANYDLGWLKWEGVEVKGSVCDVQLAEPLIDEYARSYSLNSLAAKYLGESKVEDELYSFLQAKFGGPKGRRQAGNIWRAPIELVEPYARGDVELPLRIWELQKKELERQDLWKVYEVEAKLCPILVDMRLRGVRVDVEKAKAIDDDWSMQLEVYGKEFPLENVNKAAALAAYCDKRGIVYSKTDKGNPSFEGSWLKENLPIVYEIRRLLKARDTFVRGYILDKHVNGRLYGTFNQLRSDEYGTVSGRLSSCLPEYVKVYTENGESTVGEVPIGAKVWTHKGRFATVLNRYVHKNSAVYKIYLTNGSSVECTSNHRLYTNEGWKTLEELGYVNQQDSIERSRNNQKGGSTVYLRGKTNDDANINCDEGGLAYSCADIKKQFRKGCLRLRKALEIFKIKSRGKESDERVIWRQTPKLQGSVTSTRWLRNCVKTGLVYWFTRTKPCFTAYCSNVRSNWFDRIAERVSCASHQPRSFGQQTLQSSVGIGCGAQGVPLSFSPIAKIDYVGTLRVYDLEVEEDHCFLADGIFVHNSNPNLQNIPARDEEIGPLVRSLFLPDEGEIVSAQDWSQIEFRLLTHYGVGKGAELARSMYRENPDMDFHTLASEITGVPRKQAKGISFGLIYGMSRNKLAAELGLSSQEAEQIFGLYHEKLPFVRETYNLAAKRASARGYVKTLLGRRARFNMWEPAKFGHGEEPIMDRELAVSNWGQVQRAYSYKALNRVLQGSAADILKMAMVRMVEEGVTGILGVPLMTVHDELVWSVPNTKEGLEAIDEAGRIMCSFDLKIPLAIDDERGENWGSVK